MYFSSHFSLSSLCSCSLFVDFLISVLTVFFLLCLAFQFWLWRVNLHVKENYTPATVIRFPVSNSVCECAYFQCCCCFCMAAPFHHLSLSLRTIQMLSKIDSFIGIQHSMLSAGYTLALENSSAHKSPFRLTWIHWLFTFKRYTIQLNVCISYASIQIETTTTTTTTITKERTRRRQWWKTDRWSAKKCIEFKFGFNLSP